MLVVAIKLNWHLIIINIGHIGGVGNWTQMVGFWTQMIRYLTGGCRILDTNGRILDMCNIRHVGYWTVSDTGHRGVGYWTGCRILDINDY